MAQTYHFSSESLEQLLNVFRRQVQYLLDVICFEVRVPALVGEATLHTEPAFHAPHLVDLHVVFELVLHRRALRPRIVRFHHDDVAKLARQRRPGTHPVLTTRTAVDAAAAVDSLIMSGACSIQST